MNGKPRAPARLRKVIERLLNSSVIKVPCSIARQMHECWPERPREPPPDTIPSTAPAPISISASMPATHWETVNRLVPCRISSWAKAIAHRAVANPERATCAPEGIEATASVSVVTLVMRASYSRVGRFSNRTTRSWQVPSSTLTSANSTGRSHNSSTAKTTRLTGKQVKGSMPWAIIFSSTGR